jgi:hypothetical protein
MVILPDRRVGIGHFDQTSSLPAKLTVQTVTSSEPGVVARGASGQTADLFQAQDSGGNPLSSLAKADGSFGPAHLSDSAASNDSVYYSTTQNKLVYKDSSGTVNPLY